MAKCSKMAKLPSAAFEDMPDEIVLQIFKHLEFYDNASSSQVCKRWKLLSEDQSLWERINLGGRKAPAKFIEKALRHGCQYLSLCGTEIEGVPGPSTFSVENQLKYLSFSHIFSHHKVLMKNLLGATQVLEKLSIDCCYYDKPNIIQNKQTLTVLRISEHKYLNFEIVQSIFTNCLELTEVNLEVRVTFKIKYVDCRDVEHLNIVCQNLIGL